MMIFIHHSPGYFPEKTSRNSAGPLNLRSLFHHALLDVGDGGKEQADELFRPAKDTSLHEITDDLNPPAQENIQNTIGVGGFVPEFNEAFNSDRKEVDLPAVEDDLIDPSSSPGMTYKSPEQDDPSKTQSFDHMRAENNIGPEESFVLEDPSLDHHADQKGDGGALGLEEVPIREDPQVHSQEESGIFPGDNHLMEPFTEGNVEAFASPQDEVLSHNEDISRISLHAEHEAPTENHPGMASEEQGEVKEGSVNQDGKSLLEDWFWTLGFEGRDKWVNNPDVSEAIWTDPGPSHSEHDPYAPRIPVINRPVDKSKNAPGSIQVLGSMPLISSHAINSMYQNDRISFPVTLSTMDIHPSLAPTSPIVILSSYGLRPSQPISIFQLTASPTSAPSPTPSMLLPVVKAIGTARPSHTPDAISIEENKGSATAMSSLGIMPIILISAGCLVAGVIGVVLLTRVSRRWRKKEERQLQIEQCRTRLAKW